MSDKLIVLNKDEDSVSFVDTENLTVLRTVEVERNPHEVAVTPDGGKAFVSNAGADSVSVFDMRTLEVVDTIRHPDSCYPHYIAPS